MDDIRLFDVRLNERGGFTLTAYDLQKYVLNLLDAGTLDEKQAEALLGKHGALDDDIVD